MESVFEVFTRYSGLFDVLELVGLVFLLVIVSETVWDVFSGERKKFGETFANFAIQLGNVVLERTTFGLAFIIGLAIATPFALMEIEHSWWSWALAIVFADFLYYWMHRFEHEIRILWAHHSVHHSSPEFNLSTSMRLAWIEGAIEWIFFVPMILAGFDLVQTVAAISIVVLYQTWIHTDKIGKLGWLDKVFNTPSVHRVHHGKNAQYIDKNYGGILILWDRLFGTYEPEGEKVEYGITKPVGSVNPIVVNFKEYADIARDVWRARTASDAWGYVFRGPGWKPGRDPTGVRAGPDAGEQDENQIA